MMKIVVTVTLLAVLIAAPVLAGQQKPMSFAIKGGINPAFQELLPDPESRDGMLMGFGGGATLGINLSSNFALDTDLLYVRKGGRYKDVYRDGNDLSDQDRVFKSEIALDYFIINPEFRVAPSTTGPKPYLMAGPEFGFLMSAEWTYDSDLGKTTKDGKGDFKSTDFGINFGGGLEIPAGGATSFFLEGRYSMGLTDIADHPLEEEGGTAKNRSVFGFAGIRF